MNKAIHKIDMTEWFNEKTNNVQVWYTVQFTNIDGYPIIGHFDTLEEAEEYLLQQIKIKQSFKVK